MTIEHIVTNEEVEAAYEARHNAFCNNADNRYALADRAMALVLIYESQREYRDAREAASIARFVEAYTAAYDSDEG